MAVDRTSGALARAVLASGHAGAWLFFATFLIGVFEVVARYAFSAPTTWAHVTSTALCVTAFALGGAYAMAQDAHMRVTVVSDRLSPSWQRAAALLSLTCGAIYLAGLGWGLAIEARQSLWRFDGMDGAWTPEETPGPPHWPLPAFAKTVLLLGAVLFLLAVIDSARRRLRRPPG